MNKNIEAIAAVVESSPSISEVLSHAGDHYAGNTFLVEGQKRWSYKEFNDLVDRCCHFFETLDIQRGDVVSVILRNSADYLVIYFAAIRSRVILNPFPFHLGSNEVLDKIDILTPKLVCCHKAHYKDLKDSKYRVLNLDDIEGESLLEHLQQYSPLKKASSSVDHDQVAMMYYSSGTTGKPKIIEYTHRSMVLCQASILRSQFVEPGSTHLCVLPLGHTAALRYTIKPCVCTGSTVVLYESFWKVRSMLWDEVARHKATFMEVVPSILMAILNTPYRNYVAEQSRSLDFIGCGSAFLPQGLQEAFEQKFGVPVSNLYGLSETNATHFDNPREQNRKTGNIGRPFDIVDVKIFDEEGREVANGEPGEFGIRGPGLLKGYFKDERPFGEYFHEGYFMTGDLGWRDSEGIYYYLDRKKDIIIKGGVNIAPSQIEEVLLTYPSVVEAAVIGKPDMLLGEVIKGFVVPKEGGEPLDPKALVAYCRERLGSYKTPAEISVVSELPKGPSGKILKRQLREKEYRQLPNGLAAEQHQAGA